MQPRLKAHIIQAARDRMKKPGSLVHLLRMVWHIIEPTTPYLHNWHVDVVCDHLEKLYSGEIKDLLINIPPGCMKSTLCSVVFPIWCWIQEPGYRSLCASYDSGNALRDAQKMIDVVSSEWFKARWGDSVMLTSSKPAAGRFGNTAKGSRYSLSLGMGITGKHFDLINIDDPHNAKMVSVADIKAFEGIWRNVLPTRARTPKNLKRLMAMQRLHFKDGSALFMKEPSCVHLCIPMEYNPKTTIRTDYFTDPRTEENELMWPDRFDRAYVEKTKITMGPQNAASQFEQNPVPDGGLLFKSEWFQFYDVLPERLDEMLISVDCTFAGSDNSDYTVLQVWAREGGRYYLVDQFRDKIAFPDLVKMLHVWIKKYPYAVTKLVEGKANGQALINTLEAEVPGIVKINPTASKVARANAITGYVKAGSVLFPQFAPFKNDLLTELEAFPVGTNDDQVDAMSQALNYWIAEGQGIVEAMQAAKANNVDFDQLFNY